MSLRPCPDHRLAAQAPQGQHREATASRKDREPSKRAMRNAERARTHTLARAPRSDRAQTPLGPVALQQKQSDRRLLCRYPLGPDELRTVFAYNRHKAVLERPKTAPGEEPVPRVVPAHGPVPHLSASPALSAAST